MEDIQKMIAAQRGDLAALLADLPEQRWDEPTLCAGWRVAELVAHITMPFRYSSRRFMLELAKSRGNFNQMADRRARQDARELTVAEQTAALADNVNHPWKPPGGGYLGALTHDIIHGLDITVPLGIGQIVPADRLGTILPSMTTPKIIRYFGTDVSGVELRATDMDWAFGSGPAVMGRAQDLALVLCGRKLPPGHLEGEHSARFTAA
ncbi:MAG TPA: maleylpyruvate isomerase family mycothiol-dependent enzyme [Streptosporangiaceae bacterium]